MLRKVLCLYKWIYRGIKVNFRSKIIGGYICWVEGFYKVWKWVSKLGWD